MELSTQDSGCPLPELVDNVSVQFPARSTWRRPAAPPPSIVLSASNDKGHAGLLKIGEFASLAGTNLRTLRYYEELGLLTPAERSQGGFRYYRPTDLNRVQMIHNLQELGLHLEAIRDLLDMRGTANRAELLQKVTAALTEQQRLIDERVQTLEEQKRHIAEALAKVHVCVEDCTRVPGENNNFCEPCQQTGDPLPAFLSALF